MNSISKIIFLLFISTGIKAQSDTTYYYSNNSYVRKEDVKKATYYEISDSTKRNGKVSRYYIDHLPYGNANYVDDEMHGPYITYYKNGIVKESGLYNKDEVVGLRKRRYQNGTMRSIEVMNNKEMDLETPKMVTAWDSLGKVLVNKGVGYYEIPNFYDPTYLDKGRYENGDKIGPWSTYKNDHLEYKEEFDSSGQLIGGLSYDSLGNTLSYTESHVGAEYPGGKNSWDKFLKKNMKYPKEARKKGIEGAVYLTFRIDKKGGVRDVEVVRGFNFACDKEAYRVVRLSKNWKPAQNRGEIVEQEMRLKVIFRLK